MYKQEKTKIFPRTSCDQYFNLINSHFQNIIRRMVDQNLAIEERKCKINYCHKKTMQSRKQTRLTESKKTCNDNVLVVR